MSRRNVFTIERKYFTDSLFSNYKPRWDRQTDGRTKTSLCSMRLHVRRLHQHHHYHKNATANQKNCPRSKIDRTSDVAKIWLFFCTAHGNDFELILTVKMENRHPVDGSFGSEFPAICNHCVVMAAWSRKTLKFCEKLFWVFLEKLPLR